MRAILCASLITFAAPAQGCEVALLLAVDVSGSVDPSDYRIQMDGLAAGLTDRAISDALIEGQSKLALLQWTGSGRQQVVIDWTQMRDVADVADFADQVIAAPRVWRNYSTAIGDAMAMSVGAFALVPECKRYVIDISGDGPSNEGRPPREIWPELAAAGITVNALVIEDNVPGLTAYFEAEVITGPGAFAVTADTFADYPYEIARKLLRELTKAVAETERGEPHFVITDFQSVITRENNLDRRAHFSRLRPVSWRDSFNGMVQ